MSWRIGMKAACIADSEGWFRLGPYSGWQHVRFTLTGRRPKSNGPRKNEVLTVSDVGSQYEAGTVLQFAGWGNQLFAANSFRPIIEDTAEADLSAELAETFLKGQPPIEQEVYNPQYA